MKTVKLSGGPQVFIWCGGCLTVDTVMFVVGVIALLGFDSLRVFFFALGVTVLMFATILVLAAIELRRVFKA